MAMRITELVPWLPLASTLAFIMVLPLLSEELPDHPDLREHEQGRE